MGRAGQLLLLFVLASLLGLAGLASPAGFLTSNCAGAPAPAFARSASGDGDSIDLFDQDTIAAIAESRFAAPETITDEFVATLFVAPLSGDHAPSVSRGPPSTF
jgi:hypothetical protein